jgi:hypothetical protein
VADPIDPNDHEPDILAVPVDRPVAYRVLDAGSSAVGDAAPLT